MTLTKRIAAAATTGFVLGLPVSTSAQTGAAVSSDAWAWRFGVNLWLPNINSSTRFDLPNGDNISAESDPGKYLSKLKSVFMGSLEARRGPWSFLADATYLNLGDLKSKVTSISGPGGIVTVPIDAGTRTELKGFIGTFEGGYAVFQTPAARADVVAGVRYASLKTKLDWQLSGPTGGLAAEGGVDARQDLLDGVAGVRGSVNLGGNWDFRYYVDAGTGSSRFTWQALTGVGYRFSWGDAVLSYRHLSYDFHDDRPISDIKLSGPQLEVGFKF